MRKTNRLTFAAVMTALFTITAAAASLINNIVLLMAGSIFLCAVVIECGRGYGLAAGIASALLALLLVSNKSFALICLGFIWYYPSLKSLIESKIGKKSVSAIVKAVIFAAVTLIAALCTELIGILPENTAWYYYVLVFAMLIIYDILLGALIDFYIEKIAPKIKR